MLSRVPLFSFQVAVCLAFGACQAPGTSPPVTGEDPRARAARLAQEILIVDTHVDVPYRLAQKAEDISQRTAEGDFDYPRARQGGLDAPFMSIYVPSSYQKAGGAKAYADGLIDMVEGFAADWPDKFAMARSPQDVRRRVAEGKVALPLGIENGAAIEDDVANIEHFRDRGVGYITLTHAENNLICDSSYQDEPTWNGLSPFGREVVAEMNRKGVLVDISHVTDEAARQVLEISTAPVIASHSSCRTFTPGWERNLSDDLIRLIGEKGGVVNINFGSAFLTAEANEQSKAHHDAVRSYREANHLDEHSPEVEAFSKRYWEEHPKVYATLDDVVDHIDHAVRLAGVDHVGLGSDFDGVGDSLPEGLKDVSGYPNLIEAMISRGYTEDQVRKICGENLLRVWDQARRSADPPLTAPGS